MNGRLRQRLERIDPMNSGVPTEPTTSRSSQELLERIMSTPLKEKPESSATPRRTWVVAVAAVAVLVGAVAGGIALTGDEATPTASGPPLTLNAGGEDLMASCIAFSADELDRVAEIAFAGTVGDVNGPTVTLGVDRWYRGGDAAAVVLNAPQGMEALIGGIPFVVGDQYLISAQNGDVNYCGFSGPATSEYRAAFETAFARG